MRRRDFYELLSRLDRLEVSLMIRDPGSALAADAYDGLRKQVIAAAQARMSHLVQLAEMREAIRKQAPLETLSDLVKEWSRQAGLEVATGSDDPSQFEIVSGKGDSLEILTPAYVDTVTGRVVRRGEARATESVSAAEPDLKPLEEGGSK